MVHGTEQPGGIWPGKVRSQAARQSAGAGGLGSFLCFQVFQSSVQPIRSRDVLLTLSRRC